MYKFGKRSTKNLSEAHEDLQKIFREVIKHHNCSVLEGFRTEEEQNYLNKTGKSMLVWPKSKHNVKPTKAVDVVPYPIDWDDIPRFREFCSFVKGVAAGMGIELVSGGLDWVTFKDYPHFELK